MKDLAGKKRDRDRGTVTLRPTAPYVTIIWGEYKSTTFQKYKNVKCKHTQLKTYNNQKYKLQMHTVRERLLHDTHRPNY